MNTKITEISPSATGSGNNLPELVTTWEKSNLTQKEFCNLHHLTNNKFQYWRRKLKSSQGKKCKNFVSVIPQYRNEGPGMRQPLMEVIYPNGKQVNLYTAAKPSLLRLLIG